MPRVISIHIFINRFTSVFRLDLIQFLAMIVERLEAFKLIEKVATLYDDHLLGLASKYDRAIGCAYICIMLLVRG